MTSRVICLADQPDDLIINRYRMLSSANMEVTLCLDASSTHDRNIPPDVVVDTFRFTDIGRNGYQPISNSVLPGNNHFAIIDRAAESRHEFTWCIEYDVLFNGCWSVFFHHHSANKADFLSSHIHSRTEDPGWHWWQTFRPPPLSKDADHEAPLVRAFNPVYRISRPAAQFLRKQFRLGWRGHHEVSIPTLLSCGGFTIEDFGGEGSFVSEKNFGRWYTPETFNHLRPTASLADPQMSNMLFHPVKAAVPTRLGVLG